MYLLSRRMDQSEVPKIKILKEWYFMSCCVNPYPAKLIYLNFQPLEVVSQYRDTELSSG